MRLNHKTVFISGATSGIGEAALRQSIQEGAFVLFTARHAEHIQQTEQQFPGRCRGFVNDSGNIQDQMQLVEQLCLLNIQLDAVFLNAGDVTHLPFGSWTPAQFDLLLNTNLKGPFFFLQAVLPVLNPGCSVVLCGSASIHIALEQSSLYAASKIALRSLAKTLSRELLDQNIRFNLLSPGPTQTPALNKVAPTDEAKLILQQQIRNLVPLKRLAEPSEIANAFIFLASDESRFVVGTELLVDGGVANL